MGNWLITYSFVFCCFLLSGLLLSCNIEPDYTRPIKTIDSLINVLDDASDEYISVMSSADTTWTDSIQMQLNYIQTNYRIIMNKEMAEILREYRNIPKSLPVIYENDLEINHEISFSQNQLSELHQALLLNATNDAAGNPINEAYIQNAIIQEEKSIIRLKEKMKQNRELHVSVNSRYLDLYPVVRNWVDSIPKKKMIK